MLRQSGEFASDGRETVEVMRREHRIACGRMARAPRARGVNAA